MHLKRREKERERERLEGDIENGKIDTEAWTKLANSIGVELDPKTKESSSNCCSGHHVGFAIAALLSHSLLSFSYLLVVQELLGTYIHTHILLLQNFLFSKSFDDSFDDFSTFSTFSTKIMVPEIFFYPKIQATFFVRA